MQNNLWGSTTYEQNLEPQGLSDCRSAPSGFRQGVRACASACSTRLESPVFPMAYARAKSFGPFALHLSLLHPIPSPISRNRQNCGEWQNNLWGSTTYGQNLEPQGLSNGDSAPSGFRQGVRTRARLCGTRSHLSYFLWLTRRAKSFAPSRCAGSCFIPSPRRSLGIGKTAGMAK
jgi:hypothetical protein